MRKIERFPENINAEVKKLSLEPTIHPTCRIINCSLGMWTELMEHTSIKDSSLGDYSYTAGFNNIIYSNIGKFANIASMVRINPGNHPMDRVCQHHMLYRRKQYDLGEFDDFEFFEWRKSHPCHIGHDVWIGHAAIIMPGVTLGHGCVVGAGSVVTHDVEPYAIVAGVPARTIRLRFAESAVADFLKIAWWDWEDSVLRSRINDLKNPSLFLEKYA